MNAEQCDGLDMLLRFQKEKASEYDEVIKLEAKTKVDTAKTIALYFEYKKHVSKWRSGLLSYPHHTKLLVKILSRNMRLRNDWPTLT